MMFGSSKIGGEAKCHVRIFAFGFSMVRLETPLYIELK